MKYVGITAALAIACLLVMPALSMPDQDGSKMDSKADVEQAMCCQHQICPPCQEPKGPMGDDGKQQIGPCKGTDGGQKFGPESMKNDKGFCHKSIKSMMDGNRRGGNEFCHKLVKSMMDGKCQGPVGEKGEDGKMTQCQNKDWREKGEDGKMTQCQNKDWREKGEDGKMTQCQNKDWGEKGEDGKMTQCQNKDREQTLCPKPMMDGKALCHKPIKSMMGDEKKGDGKGDKEEVAIFMLIRQ
jgi:hypothetical protein